MSNKPGNKWYELNLRPKQVYVWKIITLKIMHFILFSPKMAPLGDSWE